jgi:preprotein translocase subunit SecF
MEEKKESKQKLKTKVVKFHNKYYKHLLIIPAIILILSFAYMGIFYSNNHDFMHKDISLTGGTTITIYEKIDIDELKTHLSDKLESLSVREISDLITREQKAVIIETTSEKNQAKTFLEEYLGYELVDGENSSFEFTGSALSESFFSQLVLAIITAFLFMGWVVFILFGKKLKIKLLTGFISVLPILSLFLFGLSFNLVMIFSLIALAINFIFYFKNSIPSLAIILSAFADIFMTLALFNLLGMKMSTAGIVAFLMLIGYSVDTDILLTNRVLKRHEDSLNKRLFSAFKTGITMTLTSLLAIIIALLVVSSFSAVLTKIFTVLVIGLSFDILNTWITNVSILKWYVKKKENKNEA